MNAEENIMKIDFHTHGKLAKHLPFSPEYTNWLFNEAKNSGLDAICLTEHFNTLGFDEIYRYIENNSEKLGDLFVFNGLKIFPGIEIDIAEGGHTTVIGKMEDIMAIWEEIMPFSENGKFLPLRGLAEKIKKYPVIFGAAHPFRDGSNIPYIDKENLKNFDFIEFNGKDAVLSRDTEEKVYSFANDIGLSVVAGSDTHQALQYGCIFNEFGKDFSTAAELLCLLKNRDFEIKLSETADFKVKSACILKKALKKIHSLGGDYVSVLINEK